MPARPRRPRRRGKQANGFDLLDQFIDHGVQRVVTAFGTAAARQIEDGPEALALEPEHTCAKCEAPTGHVCFWCRRPHCADHFEFHNEEGWAICARCMRFMVQSAQGVIRAGVQARQARRPAAQPPRPSASAAPTSPAPWEVLGVLPTADEQALKRAYHKLCMEHHPDRNPGNPEATRRFQEVTDAYSAMKSALQSSP